MKKKLFQLGEHVTLMPPESCENNNGNRNQHWYSTIPIMKNEPVCKIDRYDVFVPEKNCWVVEVLIETKTGFNEHARVLECELWEYWERIEYPVKLFVWDGTGRPLKKKVLGFLKNTKSPFIVNHFESIFLLGYKYAMPGIQKIPPKINGIPGMLRWDPHLGDIALKYGNVRLRMKELPELLAMMDDMNIEKITIHNIIISHAKLEEVYEWMVKNT